MVSVLVGTLVFLGLYALRLYNYLLFHSVAEFFSVVVACSVFLVAWNARRSQDNHYFLFVGIAYLFAGVVDLVHLLAYKGMGVFPGYDANLSTQLWIGGRYLQAISLLLAPRFAGRTLDPTRTVVGYAAAVSLLFGSVFAGVFPDCYIEGAGLTAFKIYSEYAICAILLASIFLLFAKRQQFEGDVLRRIALSVAVAIGSELLFTLYRDVYGFYNLAGHYLKILSFFLVYRAVIGIDLTRRLELNRLLQRELDERQRAQVEVRAAKEALERRVAERTAELKALAERLRAELKTRLKSERALAESEERFRALVERSPVGIFIVQGGRIVYRNPEQARLFGPIPAAFEFRAFRDVHPEDAAKFDALCASVSGEGGPAREMDLRFYPYGKSPEGVDMRWVHVRTSPMNYRGGKAVLVSMADITHQKEMEHQILIREKMASLGHVAAGIAHEIRNPLSGINIYVSALEKIHEDAECLGAEGQEQAAGIVRQIQDASGRIESVIKKVMDFVRPSAVRTGPSDINLAIGNAIDFTAVTLRKRGITLDRSRLESLPKCNADHPLITQVVMNLITNAAQAIEDAQGPRIMEVSSGVQDRRIVICVSDSGPGVPPAIRDKIFDPFYTTRKDGYGIGLSFSRRVISDHGGTLKVVTGRLGGAEFRIELPVEAEPETGPA
jgi:PAS domain S-box-containing protein